MSADKTSCCLCPNIRIGSSQTKYQLEDSIQLAVINKEETKQEESTQDEKLSETREYEPIFAFQHFTIVRQFSEGLFVKCLLRCVFHPFLLLYQTLMFLFPSKIAKFPIKQRFDDLSTILYYDFLHLFIGRAHIHKEDETLLNAEWFLSQSTRQKALRVIITLLILSMDIYIACAFAFSSSLMINNLSIIETAVPSPFQLLFCIILLYCYFIASSRPSFPEELPTIDELSKFTLQLEENYSLSVTAFYRKYLTQNDDTHAVHITRRTLICCLLNALLFALSAPVHSIARLIQQEQLGLLHLSISICSFLVSVCLSLCLSLIISIQGLSSLHTNFRQMQIITHLLDRYSYIPLNNICINKLCCKANDRFNLPFLKLSENNIIAWSELRSFVYWKNKISMAKAEAILVCIIFLTVATGFYELWRLISEEHLMDVLFSPSFLSILWSFIALFTLIMVMLMDAFGIQKFQKYQERFILHQRGKLEYEIMNKSRDNQQALVLLNCKDHFDILLRLVKDQNISPKLYGITLDKTLLRSIIALSISAVYAIAQYFWNTK